KAHERYAVADQVLGLLIREIVSSACKANAAEISGTLAFVIACFRLCCAAAKARAFRSSERGRPARTLPAAVAASASRHRTALTCDDQTGGGRVPSHKSRPSSAPRRRSP